MFDGIEAPCMGCGKRVVDTANGYTCHNDCAAYLAYRADRTKLYEERRDNVLNARELRNYKRDTRYKLKKRVHKK